MSGEQEHRFLDLCVGSLPVVCACCALTAGSALLLRVLANSLQ
ncbi:MAG: hypothetical protein Q7R81_05065 [Candidatus Peregrinibacteria bacterium]|nr:hypothetical protein [Candidatus Peregrinibacteria bacterium]